MHVPPFWHGLQLQKLCTIVGDIVGDGDDDVGFGDDDGNGVGVVKSFSHEIPANPGRQTHLNGPVLEI